MNRPKSLPVNIKNFVNPYLFWYVEDAKEVDTDDLEKDLKAALSVPTLDDPIVGEHVAVQDGGRFKRALVTAINKEGYICWLIDHGTVHVALEVYELPQKFREEPAAVQQACLRDAVCLRAEMMIESSEIEYEPVVDDVLGSLSVIQQFISDSSKVFFKLMEMRDGIAYGDIIVKNDEGFHSVIEVMVRNNVLGINKELFEKGMMKYKSYTPEILNLLLSRSRNSSRSNSTVSSKHSIRNSMNTSKIVTEDNTYLPTVVGIGRGSRKGFLKPQQMKKETLETTINLSTSKMEDLPSESADPMTSSSYEESPTKSEPEQTETPPKPTSSDTSGSDSGKSTIRKKLNTPTILKILMEGGRASRNDLPKQKESGTEKEHMQDKSFEETLLSYKNNRNLPKLIPAGVVALPPSKKPPSKKPPPKKPPSKDSSKNNLKKCPFVKPPQSADHQLTSSTSSVTATTSSSAAIESTSSTEESSEADTDEILCRAMGVGHKKVVGCTCDKCLKWDKNGIACSDEEEFDIKVREERKAPVKPALLLKKDEVDSEIRIKRVTCRTENYVRSQYPVVLVHGVTILDPQKYISDIPFHADIHQCLRKIEFTQSKRIQMYTWPAILRSMNVFYVMGPKSGKTMTYMIPICSFLLENKRYDSLSKYFKGPIGVVLCEGTKQAEEVHKMISWLLTTTRNKFSLRIALPPLDKLCTKQFTSKCDLLITTLPCLITLLTSRIIDLKRLCHLVLEDADVLLRKYPKHLNAVLSLVQNVLESRTCRLSVQMIASAKHWTKEIEDLAQRLYLSPLVCIGAYLEAAVYGRASVKMHFMSSKRKQSSLVDLLSDEENKFSKIVVFCNDEEQTEEAVSLFASRSIESIILTQKNSGIEINTAMSRWKNDSNAFYPVLVCTDHVHTANINITDATVIVHYGLPESWTHFALRFSCFIDNYESPLGKVTSVTSENCRSYIFVDETCQDKGLKLIKFLQSMNAVLPQKFMKYCEGVVADQENKKKQGNIELCHSLKLLGKCETDLCSKRHIICKNLDEIEHLPNSGKIRFKLVQVKDVSLFSINIVTHFSTNGEINTNEINVTDIENRLTEVLKESQESVGNVQIGDMVAVEHENRFKRCKIVAIEQVNDITKMPTEVQILYCDSYMTAKISVYNLCVLPEEFKHIPVQGVLAYIANMVPPGGDVNYSSFSRTRLKHTITSTEQQHEDAIYEAEIVLRLGYNLWLTDVYLVKDLPRSETTVTLLNFRDKLLKHNLAEYNENAIRPILELARNSGIDFVEVDLSENKGKVAQKGFYRKQVTPNWAFLDEDVEFHEVYFISAKTPGEFYVRLAKFNKQLNNLQDDIRDAISKPFYPDKVEVEVGQCYLAPDPREVGCYCRVVVVGLLDGTADCFCVDFGEQFYFNRYELKYLPNELINKLPFQAIECKLHGVSPVLDCWSPEATDVLFQYSFEEGTDYYRTLHCSAFKKEAANLTGGDKYSVVLIDMTRNKPVIINKIMVDCGLGIDVESEKWDVKLPVIPDGSEDYSSDYDEEVNNVELVIDDDETIPSPNVFNFEDQSVWDIQIFDVQAMIQGKPVKIKETAEVRELPAMLALPPASHCTPQVRWFQHKERVELNILLVDCRIYDLRLVRGQLLHFSTVHDGKSYKLNLHLFGKVEKTYQHRAAGPSVKVTLTKCKADDWPRLVLQKGMKHIKYDLTRCVVEDDDKKTVPILTFSEELGEPILEENEYEICVGSDTDWSESDIESE